MLIIRMFTWPVLLYLCLENVRCFWSRFLSKKHNQPCTKTEKTYSRVYVYIFNPESVAQDTQHCANAGNCVLRYEITFCRPRPLQRISVCSYVSYHKYALKVCLGSLLSQYLIIIILNSYADVKKTIVLC